MTGPLSPARKRPSAGPDDTERRLPPATVASMFAAQAERVPDAVAVIDEHVELTNRQLDAAANRLARHLRTLGVGPEDVVAVSLPRSVHLVTALLAVLKAGAAYLPIDPDYPAARNSSMIEDAAPVCVIADTGTAARIPVTVGLLVLDDPDTAAQLSRIPSHPVTDDELVRPLHPDHPAYVIYTSGSTGRPKGVVVTHRGITNRLRWMQDRYSLTPEDRVLQKTPSGFDVSVWEFFWALCEGAVLVVARPGGHRDPAYLAQLIRDAAVTVVHFVPSMLLEFLHLPEAARCGSLRQVLCSGEALQPYLVQRFHTVLGGRLDNLYGPTEASVDVSYWESSPAVPDCVPIGRPVWNTRIYVLDDTLAPVPAGAAGEIYLAGVQLARGYLNRSALTADRFVADPFVAGERMYRTGDQGRWNADGELEFLGRLDDQVKIRGVRIEPGEIEAVLARRPGIGQCAVVAREDRPGDRRLVAYLVPTSPDHRIDIAEVRRALSAELPSHLVPTGFVVLPALPSTPSGKLDRRALPAPERRATSAGRAPRNAREEILCGLFAEVLGVDGVTVDDGFLELGGHSLLATRLISRIRAVLDVEPAMGELIDARTIAELAERLDRARGARIPLRPAERPARLPLSFAQRRLWFLHELEPGPRYNIPHALRLTGQLDTGVLQRALEDLVRRHESLRTTFPQVDGDPCQHVHTGPGSAPILTIRAVRPEQLPEALRLAARHTFDLAEEPPMRATVFHSGPDDHTLLLCFHHIACDGMSVKPLFDDLARAYTARKAGRAPEWDALPVQYADYTLWQHAILGTEDDPDSVLSKQTEYWKNALAGMPVRLELPASRVPVDTSREADRVAFDVAPDTHRRLADLAAASRSTLFMVLHAAVAVLLTRLGAGEDIPLGTVVAGRDDEALSELVGFFVNTLVLRTDTSGDPTFRELLARVREADLAAYSHQDVPFDHLVEVLNPDRSGARQPLFQVMLTVADDPDVPLMPGLRTEPYEIESGDAKFDLTARAVEHRLDDGSPGGIGFAVEFAADLFDRPTAEAVVARLARMLEAVAVDPDVRIGDVEVLSAVERRELLVDWNDTPCPETAWSLPEMFAVQVARIPDAVAVECAERVLTYRGLDEASGALAGVLAGAGVGAESAVAVLLQRGVDVVVASLAVLKAGGAYVPLAVDGSAERLASVLSGVGARVLVVEAATCAHPVVARAVDDGIRIIQVDAPDALDAPDMAATAAGPATPLPSVHPDQLAYVIHTSGSSGVPKGVGISHRSVAAFVLDGCWDAVPGAESGEAPVVLMQAPHAFDASTYEIWMPLLRGGRVVVAEPGPVDTAAFGALIRNSGVNAVLFTPVLFNAMVEEALEDLGGLRLMWTGGDVVSGAAIERMLDRYPEMLVAAAWGTTETTVISSWQPLQSPYKAGGPVAAGRVMDNTRLYVLDDRLSLLPVGVAGEVYVGGSGLARGYASRPDLTAERFIADPFGPPGSRMYRTGDVMRWRPDGSLDFVGRADAQVKIRGFRVEPAEVEAVLARDPEIAGVTVAVRTEKGGSKQLIAYVVPAAGSSPDPAWLQARAAGALPDYMVPAAFVVLDAFPMTPNGKVDRRALPEPPPITAAASGRAPANAREEQLCGLFAEILGLPPVGPDDNFFKLGGHSLLVTRLVNRIRVAMNAELQVRELFEAPSPALLAARLDRPGPARPAKPALIPRPRP